MVTTKSLILILAGVCGGGLLGYLSYKAITGPSRPVDRRAAAVRGEDKKVATRESEAAVRRKQVAESLKELENKAKDRTRVSLEMKIAQAGLAITKQTFFVASCVLAVVGGLADDGALFCRRWPHRGRPRSPQLGVKLPAEKAD